VMDVEVYRRGGKGDKQCRKKGKRTDSHPLHSIKTVRKKGSKAWLIRLGRKKKFQVNVLLSLVVKDQSKKC